MAEGRLSKLLTARELARLIGVSQSAVSRAFTPGASISGDLRARILTAAERFGYRPNAIAQILSTRRSNIVGLVLSELRNPFYPALVELLTRRLQEGGLQTLLFNITPGSDVKQQLTALRLYNVDALIIVSATVLRGPDLMWASEGRRTVLLNRVAEDAPLASVTCDNEAGARAIADHFAALGLRRVAYVAGLSQTRTGRERQESFVRRVAERGMTLTAVVDGSEYSYEAGRRAALSLLPGGRTEGILFANDLMAAGGLDAARDDLGLSVPGDVRIAGFDDIAMAAWPRYRLTTYRQPVEEIVESTLELINAPEIEPGCIRRIPGRLVLRASTTGEPPPLRA